ncbi:MAG: hypothetical protein Q4E22_06440 [Coriobacteriia bacterium]|nr:hypothetical protein [Coriobacteriia bacterium]
MGQVQKRLVAVLSTVLLAVAMFGFASTALAIPNSGGAAISFA